MKTISILLAAGMFMLAACTNTAEQVLTANEKEVLAQEVETTINKMMDGMRNIDITAAFESTFLMDDDFRYIDIYGKVLTKEGFLKNVHAVFDNVEKMEFDFSIPVIRVIDRNVAVVTLVYSGKFYFPGSVLSAPDCGSTLVLNKIDNQWKVVHFHESLQETELVTTDL